MIVPRRERPFIPIEGVGTVLAVAKSVRALPKTDEADGRAALSGYQG